MILYDTDKGILKYEGGTEDLIVEACYLIHRLKRDLKTDKDKISLIRFCMSVLMETEEDNAGT